MRSEEGLEQMNQSLRRALGKVKGLEDRMGRDGGDGGGGNGGDLEGVLEENALLKRKNEMVERRIGGMEVEMDRLTLL